MRAQAGGLNMNDRVAVATFVTGKAPTGNAGTAPESNLCKERGAAVGAEVGSSWNGWGRDLTIRASNLTPGLRPPRCRT